MRMNYSTVYRERKGKKKKKDEEAVLLAGLQIWYLEKKFDKSSRFILVSARTILNDGLLTHSIRYQKKKKGKKRMRKKCNEIQNSRAY